VVEEGEAGAFEIEALELCALPGLQEPPDLQVSVCVDELVVGGQRNQVALVALLEYFIHVPHSQVYFAADAILASALQEFVVAAPEEARHCGPIQFLFEWL
jgi:hypothetical protein